MNISNDRHPVRVGVSDAFFHALSVFNGMWWCCLTCCAVIELHIRTYASLQVLCMDLYKRTTRWTSVWGMCYPILPLSCPLFQVSTSLSEAMECFDTAYSLVWLYRCLSDCIMAQSCLECSNVAQSSDFNCGWCQSLNRCVSPQHHSAVLDVVCFRCSVSESKRTLKFEHLFEEQCLLWHICACDYHFM